MNVGDRKKDKRSVVKSLGQVRKPTKWDHLICMDRVN